ncbi:MAG: translocated intimin receptor Tir [Candidatus Dormibacteraceae bacterium]
MKTGLVKCILTDSQLWVPVIVMVIGLALLAILR